MGYKWFVSGRQKKQREDRKKLKKGKKPYSCSSPYKTAYILIAIISRK